MVRPASPVLRPRRPAGGSARMLAAVLGAVLGAVKVRTRYGVPAETGACSGGGAIDPEEGAESPAPGGEDAGSRPSDSVGELLTPDGWPPPGGGSSSAPGLDEQQLDEVLADAAGPDDE